MRPNRTAPIGEPHSIAIQRLNVVNQLTAPIVNRFVMEDQKIVQRCRKRPDCMRLRGQKWPHVQEIGERYEFAALAPVLEKRDA